MMKHLLTILFVGLMNVAFCAPDTLSAPPDSLVKKRLYSTLTTQLLTYTAGMSFLSFIWYKDHERVPFHYYNDSKGYLQMDKCGHAYTGYIESRAAGRAFRWSGIKPSTSAWLGGIVGFLYQAPIEVFDGLYEGWGFSWSDIGANTIGSALFTSQELIWQEQWMIMKFSYSPSAYRTIIPQRLGETHFESFFNDYNGHTYWMSANLQSITNSQRLPKWLNVTLGYSANGMLGEFENPEVYAGRPVPDTPRYRQWLLSLDVDFSRIPTRKKWLKTVFSTINGIKVPFTALEYNSLHGLQFRPVYF